MKRRYPAKIKKDHIGEGAFYITNQRISFESNTRGLCMNLDLLNIKKWEVKKKSIKIFWAEIPIGNTKPQTNDPVFNVEIEFNKKDGKKIDIKEVHYSLFYANINKHKYGYTGNGFYVDDDGKLYNHFQIKKRPLSAKQSNTDDFTIIIEAWELSRLENNNGESLLSQDIFEHYTLCYAQRGDMIRTDAGLREPHIMKEDLDHKFKSCMTLSTRYEKWSKDIEKEIEQYKQEGKIEEIEKYIKPDTEPPTKYIHYLFPGGNKYDVVKYNKSYSIICKRQAELVEKVKHQFKNSGHLSAYKILLNKKISEKYTNGEDISNYDPQIQVGPTRVEMAKQKIKEYRKKLTEQI